ncbi:DUF927 domain-containing protein [Sporolituus thermophilus]|uniref:DUF927 domain-containing protein n=1 Tax=Sporolituus thermophilus DSM 23256 TaxID=1123285 RepID=A0A1G7MU83_9FIRM|nr:DUF927 domain-containing protein [Sporolituus thermophilus]SDF65211.1 protein of unknown function [Sporolituus thermophilus DSM 23256]
MVNYYVSKYRREEKTYYTHTGWRKIGGKWAYLHAGGAIGADGVLVDLSEGGEALSRYRLPETCEDAARAVKMAASFLEVADKRITFPLLAAAFLVVASEILRAVNIQLDFALFMVGKAQSGKSSLAALVLSFFGDFDKTAFPANFKMTPNSLEKTAFMIKDALLIVDDFHPAQNRAEKEKLKQAAQNLARAYGDGAARVRMGADLKLRAAFRPRGLAIATGEERPDIGESGQARMLFISVKRDDIDYYGKFKEVEANKRWLAKCMVAYITWLAENWEKLKEILPQIYSGARADMQTENSGRANEAAAKLALGLWLFHQFAIDSGGLAENDAVELMKEGGKILQQLAKDNIASLQTEKPTSQFITALQELAAAGQVEIIPVYQQNKPEDGKFIGCYDEQYLYLLPQMTYKAVAEFYMKQGLQFPVSSGTLWRQLHEEGLLFSRDEVRGRWTKRRAFGCCGNRPLDVIWLKKDILKD